jgi:hypothetical protein
MTPRGAGARGSTLRDRGGSRPSTDQSLVVFGVHYNYRVRQHPHTSGDWWIEFVSLQLPTLPYRVEIITILTSASQSASACLTFISEQPRQGQTGYSHTGCVRHLSPRLSGIPVPGGLRDSFGLITQQQ